MICKHNLLIPYFLNDLEKYHEILNNIASANFIE